MRTITRSLAALTATLMLAATTGCATYRTISQAEAGSAKVFSGTRLNIHALEGQSTPTRRFRASAPPYPGADLPFSFLADILLLPLTMPVALYEFVFE
jgi:uncharacterized protein YceK